MAKNQKNGTATAPIAQTVNRSQMIRDYHAANPTAGPSDIAKALSKDGLAISTALAQQVISGRKGGGKGKGLSVDTIKAAAAFVKSYKGKVEDAAAAIEMVGAFIDSCGSSEAALAALTTYSEVVASLK